ncbi:hypothetical protein TBLA_0A00190 [Henningerozyma blattae CBS 6284]|uniref:Uncharacterized protein n=1 Tax=Henningerozyma blattae (strain ATCC 34711 / CBS 6284 / DSM 70876 / NBRC 10599 / NRRL Y-10934 / UCD 77-7) TaxID=1071380 RepID=I2GUL9_HENB6|nr:hypothetical protein TBLA_0A00190 [Tetrapisispora blattae CBS 6284]CCH57821.1 hypothetical protein TBLA_0A00190 [Tetrapisispora blattae CBS 6284]
MNNTQQTQKTPALLSHQLFEANLIDRLYGKERQEEEDEESSSENAQCLTILPPINSSTLQELDLTNVVKNAQFRHDLLFDNFIKFKPNHLEKKINDIHAKQYWNILENQLLLIFNKKSSDNRNLKLLLTEFKSILISLLPENCASECNAYLNINTLLNSIRGCPSWKIAYSFLIDFIEWLQDILKRHCAPARDVLVDKIFISFKNFIIPLQNTTIVSTSTSVSTSPLPPPATIPPVSILKSTNHLIEGIKNLFDLLELMKLDILNHQIRILTPTLVSNIIQFEQHYYHVKKNSKSLPIQLNKDISDPTLLLNSTFHSLKIEIIKRLSCCLKETSLPDCLELDNYRLIKAKLQLRQLTCITICRMMYNQLLTDDQKTIPLGIFNQNIFSIVSHKHSSYWTKNISRLSLYMKQITNTPIETSFIKDWLTKNFSPHFSNLYKITEAKILNMLVDHIIPDSNLVYINLNSTNFDNFKIFNVLYLQDFLKLLKSLYLLINLHWQVYHDHYITPTEQSIHYQLPIPSPQDSASI